MSEWISVKDRLPEIGAVVLAWSISYEFEVASFDDEGFYLSNPIGRVDDVTHWMIPEPPNE